MQATATQAIIPKARGMYAKRITPAEYEELMRKRSVLEVATLLKRHPYFGDSLATLSATDPHRGQIEELLNMDVFLKYEALVRYDFSETRFSSYYLAECEMRELLKALHLLSIGLPGGYLNQIPEYLVGKLRIDLFELGQARSVQQVAEAARHTLYYDTLKARALADPMLRDFPMTEAAMLRASYAGLFALVDKSLHGRDADAVRTLFLQEAEAYNLELLLRLRVFFPKAYTPDEVRRLVLPYTFRLSRTRMNEMIEAKTPEALMTLYRRANVSHLVGPASPDDLSAEAGRATYRNAREVLHLTASPMGALAAFVSLARLTRENVVNVIEGVRYGLTPEQMRGMLRY